MSTGKRTLVSSMLWLALVANVLAVYRDSVFKTDWIWQGVGTPAYVADVGSNLAVADPESRVLAVLSATGGFVWRHMVSPGTTDLNAGLASAGGIVVTGGPQLTAWNGSDGSVVWANGYASAVYDAEGAVFADVDGEVCRLNHLTGELVRVSAPRVIRKALESNRGTFEIDANTGEMQLVNKRGHLLWERDESHINVVAAVLVSSGQAQEAPQETQAQNPVTDWSSIYNQEPITGPKWDTATLYGAWRQRLSDHLAYLRQKGLFSIFGMFLKGKTDFGFNQYLVVVGKYGAVTALDAANGGHTVWSRSDLDAIDITKAGENVVVSSRDGTKVVLNPSNGDTAVDISDDQIFVPFGYSVAPRAIVGNQGWTFAVPEGYAVIDTAQRDPEDRTASLGTVLPDNSVLYKYLNPNAVAVLMYSDSKHELLVTILDGVSGRVLSTGTHSGVQVDATHPAHIVMGEHWIVYTWWAPETTGNRIGLWTLFESQTPNERLSTAGNVSALAGTSVPVVHRKVLDAGWTIPVRSLALSRTRFGVTLRDVIVLIDGQVFALPKVLLDSASGSVDIPDSGHLSHAMSVYGASNLVVEPSLLESTYLLAAFGGPDIFFTRVAPSGEFDRLPDTFASNKLLITILALGIVAFILAPLTRRRHVELSWR